MLVYWEEVKSLEITHTGTLKIVYVGQMSSCLNMISLAYEGFSFCLTSCKFNFSQEQNQIL